MSKKKPSSSFCFVLLVCLWGVILPHIGIYAAQPEDSATLVKREDRRVIVSTENGEISAVRIDDQINGPYVLNFFTLDPNSLLLPLILHQDMVFYVHTGSGKLSWTEGADVKKADLRRGDVGRLEDGAVFFIQSNLETTQTERNKLRIFAFFAKSKDAFQEPEFVPYSSNRDALLGFDRKLLQAALGVSEELIDEISGGMRPPAIIHATTPTKRTERVWEMDEVHFLTSFLGIRSYKNAFQLNKKKKGRAGLFNIFDEDKDFENSKGWSTTVTRKKLSALRSTNIGLFMVNLTAGSMMGPHWNPTASEIAIVLHGRGIVHVVGSGFSNETGCRNMRLEVEEGDVFAVPKFNSFAQMAFNNETLVFMGFSTSAKKNHPQFLAGKASVFRALDKDVLAMSFNATNTTLDQILDAQQEYVILGCTSCAEEEWRVMQEEEKRREEEAKEERRREEEEEEKRRREEEEEAAREEEERRRQHEKEQREEEEERQREREEEAARKKEEEAARRQEQEKRKREEEEERRRREEEQREEEEQKRREMEEEAVRKREEEAVRRQEQEKRRHEEEEEAAREEERRRHEAERREEEEARQRELEEEEARKREEEAARRQEQEKRRHQEEEEAAREEEERRRHEAGRREEEEAKQKELKEEEARKREEEAARRQEQEKRRHEEEEEAAREEEEREQREEEEARRRGGETARRQEKHKRGREEEEQERRREEQAHEAQRRRQRHQERGRSEEEQAAEEERRWEEETQREEEAARQHEYDQEEEGSW